MFSAPIKVIAQKIVKFGEKKTLTICCIGKVLLPLRYESVLDDGPDAAQTAL